MHLHAVQYSTDSPSRRARLSRADAHDAVFAPPPPTRLSPTSQFLIPLLVRRHATAVTSLQVLPTSWASSAFAGLRHESALPQYLSDIVPCTLSSTPRSSVLTRVRHRLEGMFTGYGLIECYSLLFVCFHFFSFVLDSRWSFRVLSCSLSPLPSDTEHRHSFRSRALTPHPFAVFILDSGRFRCAFCRRQDSTLDFSLSPSPRRSFSLRRVHCIATDSDSII